MRSGHGPRARFIVIDVVLVATGYVVGVALRLPDPPLVDQSPWLVDLALMLPLVVVVHIGANLLAGMYRVTPSGTADISLGMRVLATSVAILSLLVWITAASIHPVPLSFILSGGLTTLALTVFVHLGRSVGRQLSDRVSPTA